MKTVKKDNIVEDFYGTKVADPYRWLEDSSSLETVEWGNSLAAQCDTYFSQAESKAFDKQRLEELWNYPKFFVPKQVKSNLFYQKNDGLQNQAVLYKRGEEQDAVVVDPNTLSEDGTIAMTNYAFSNDGAYIAYATSLHGSDWQQIHVRDIQSGQDLEDHIRYVKFTAIAWAPDHSGFFYSRFPEPGSVEKEDESNYNAVYFHKLGTSQDDDPLVHEQPDEKELMFSPMISDDEKHLCLHVFQGTASENRVFVKAIDSKVEFMRLLDDQNAGYQYITNEGRIFYFQTDLDSPNGRVIAIDLDHPEPQNWQEVLPEQDDVMDSVKFINGKFIVVLLHDAHHQLHVYNQNGTYLYQIKLPIIGSLTEMTCHKETDEIYFGMTSFLSPTIIYHYEMDDPDVTVFAESTLPVDTTDFQTEQVFYTSKDGSKIPMFLTHHNDIKLDSENPVILNGYGGFNISRTPSFNPAILRWLEKGGIYAVANLRGGNEYGEKWHKAGMLENKQNVFDDFIAAGEWLIETKYTNQKKLSIMGGSNGGLLVAACMLQRPDLFGAVICTVPVIDMLRYHKFTIGRYWIPEFGNPEKPEHFPFLYAYSPLHNIKNGQKYPPILITTAESDDRVLPAHAKKFAATLLEKADKDSTVILRLEAKAGHGLGKPTSKVIDEWADFYAFLDMELK
ncbi:prolyl oligopeptidase [Virgibacillus natechei]|uniref:prolyl oligopeptidase n=1 Tax=Virgibacillus natechei TaxID=1216297 RepID=A0ABS4IC46_9BACI|nr:prolyl oligopeptidase family serine peptidase [Virgibacillus natechei]MBP1968423.1 prolyl oligopeptidase [Virgibacillus natechei]UZD13546.1 prolyl oligopeptidase family serine peptidase [Virgibacillus natechei]